MNEVFTTEPGPETDRSSRVEWNCFYQAFERQTELFSSDTPAIIEPMSVDGSSVEHRIVTYRRLLEDVNRVASSLSKLGVGPGDRVLILVPMSTELYQCILATMKIGAVCLFIDPADGIAHLDRTAAALAPKAFIGIPRAHGLRLFSAAVRRIPIQISTWPTLLRWTRPWRELLDAGEPEWPTSEAALHDPAMISYTSGSSGSPKGVCRTHRDMRAIFAMLCEHEAKRLVGVNFCAFPVLPLDDLSFGRTSLLPRAEPGHLAEARPEDLADQLRQFPPVLISAPPGTVQTLVDHCRQHKTELPGLRHIFTGGGVVPVSLVRDVAEVWPGAELHALYGSTEAEPVSLMDGPEVLSETGVRTENGEGICVGKVAPRTEVAIVEATSDPLETVSPVDGIGEIVVRGPHVNRTYFRDPVQTRRHKIHDRLTDAWWHRMGDLGFRDEKGRLWLAGRLSHRIQTDRQTLYPAMLEPIFDSLEGVKKTALVGVRIVKDGVPRTAPCLLVELRPDGPAPEIVLERVWATARERQIPIEDVEPCDRILYDRRIGAKIQYKTLERKYGPGLRDYLGDSLAARLKLFRKLRFPITAHAIVAAVFTAGLAGMASAYWHEKVLSVMSAFFVVLGFFWHLRVFDEIKDLEFDRAVHPERPLPQGIVTPAELGRSATVVVIAEAAGAASLGLIAFGWWVLGLAYSLLMSVEFFNSLALRSNLFLYGATHSFVVVFLAQFVAAGLGVETPVLAVGLLAYSLAWTAEIARKLQMDPPEAPLQERLAQGEADESYARELGPRRTSLLLMGLQLVAASAVIQSGVATQPLQRALLIVACLGSAMAALSFWKRPTTSGGKRVEGVLALASVIYYGIVAAGPALKSVF